ncbi:MAG: 16S rRNA (cytidine(1402)-2'-O)-methyltransferase [Lachnospiraceae bacterium]|nr:16S rRNA (cytidine(1402)-2'-O)-methyltransferase [Lachnospiraceae bacterium]
MSGTLYLCATPIGNLEDITLRVLRTLREVDLIAAEDTRTSGHLLSRYEITTKLTSYHKFNEKEKGEELIGRLLAGENIALITDAGTPAISDPGEILVRLCMENGIEVTSLPGANACITALTLSGQDTRRFAFEGFLPGDKKERKEVLSEMKTERRTMVLYEAPHRLVRTLETLREELGGGRGITLCRELTKKYETIQRTTIDEAIVRAETEPPRGEYVLVIEGKSGEEILREKEELYEELPIPEHVARFEAQGMSRKEAMKAVAKERGLSRRDVYQALLTE